MSKTLTAVQKLLEEKQAGDILTIDMRKVNPFTDYFVIVTALNPRHAASLSDALEKDAEINGYTVRHIEGDEGSPWILVDLNEVIVHIFTPEGRQMYRLEALWSDQPSVRNEDNA